MKKSKLIIISIILVILLFFVYEYITSDNLEASIDINELEYPDSDYTSDVSIDDTDKVTYNEEVKISQSGNYVFEGDYLNTVITVEVDDTVDEEPVYIILNNANITSQYGELINVVSANSVIVYANEGTTNYLTQEYSSTSEDISGAAIYSKCDLYVSGSGKIIIETSYNDGINGRDDVVIEDITLDITAEADGIVGNDYVAITNANITVDSGKDGIKSSNDVDLENGNILIESGTFKISSAEDGISAQTTLQINDGDFYIESGGGFSEVLKIITLGEGGTTQNVTSFSSKSLKAFNIYVNGGNFELSSYEDAVHSDNDMYITGGVFNIECGDDGIHSDINLVIDYMELNIENGYEGIEANYITINDGIINVVVTDDAVNASSDDGIFTINGGTIYVYSTGDGLDSNGDLIITGGSIVIENEAIYTGGDYEIDVAGDITVTGGTIVDENGNDIDYETVMNSGTNKMTIQTPMNNRR